MTGGKADYQLLSFLYNFQSHLHKLRRNKWIKGYFYDAAFVKVLVVNAYLLRLPKDSYRIHLHMWAAGYFIFLKPNLSHLCLMAHYLTRIWFAGSV